MSKEISDALKLEIVWDSLGATKGLIDDLYCERNIDGFDKWSDKRMEEIFYMLNDLCIEIAETGQMAWQQASETKIKTTE